MDLLQRDLISSGWLSPLKVRILITMMLAPAIGKEEISISLRAHDGGSK